MTFHVINVLQEDIDRAIKVRKSLAISALAFTCPVYQAMTRQGFKDICVGTAAVFDREGSKIFLLPPAAKAVTGLTPGKWPSIVPFSFEIRRLE